MNFKRLKLLRAAARVRRMHVMPPLHHQTVGEHTFGVLSILVTITANVTPQLWRAALFHDATEARLGDVPAPAKWDNVPLRHGYQLADRALMEEFELEEKNLTDLEHRLLHFADLMELAMFALEECQDGNVKMAGVFDRAIGAIKKSGLIDITPAAKDLYDLVTLKFEACEFPRHRSYHDYHAND